MPVKLSNGRELSDVEVKQLNDANAKITSGGNTEADKKNVDYAKGLGWNPEAIKAPEIANDIAPMIEGPQESNFGVGGANDVAPFIPGPQDSTFNNAPTVDQPKVENPTTPVQNMVTMKGPDGNFATVDKNSSAYQDFLNRGFALSTEVMNSADQATADLQKKQSEATATAISENKPKEITPIVPVVNNGGSTLKVDANGNPIATGLSELYKDATKELAFSKDYLAKNGVEPTQEEINKGVYGSEKPTFTKTVVDSAIITKAESAGFNSLSGDEIDSLAKSMATGGLSLNDSITLMNAQTKIPETVKQAFFNSLGLSKLEQQAFFAPDENVQTLYDAKYKELDLAKKKAEISAQTEKMNNELVEAGENPFLDSTKRQGRANMITQRYTNKIDKLTTDYNDGIDQVNTYITNSLATKTNAQAKLTYMQTKAENMFTGYEADLQNEVLQRFLPTYMKESATTTASTAEASLISKLTIDKGYSQVNGWTQTDIDEAINKGIKVTKVGDKVFIDQADYLKSQEGNYEVTYDPLTGASVVFNKKTGTYGNGAGTGVNYGDLKFDTSKVGMRTDRNNNPTAMTTDVAKNGGVEGVDYVQGDPFTSNGKTYYTAKLLGDPIDTTVKAIDTMGFYTGSGNQRWTHTAMDKATWDKLDTTGKRAVVASMYQKEGGNGSLLGTPTIPTTTGSKATPEIQQIAREIVDGTRSIDTLKTMPDILQNVINTEVVRLNKEKTSQETETDPAKLAIKNSAGKKSLSVGGMTTQTGIEKTIQTFGQFEDLSKRIEDVKTGPISGLINKNPYSKTGAEVKAMITGLIPGLARGTYGEVGVLTDADIENYKKTVPNLSTPDSAKNFILAMTAKMLTNSLKNKLSVSAKAGWDVSAFLPDLESLEQRSQDMLIQQQLKLAEKSPENLKKIETQKNIDKVSNPKFGAGDSVIGNILNSIIAPKNTNSQTNNPGVNDPAGIL